MSDTAKIIEIKANLRQKAKAFRNVFNTPDGKQVLGYLEDEFERDILFQETERETVYLLGARDLLVYIKNMMEFENE